MIEMFFAFHAARLRLMRFSAWMRSCDAAAPIAASSSGAVV